MTKTEELTFKIVSLLDMMPTGRPEYIDCDYKLLQGSAVAHGLANNPEYSVSRLNIAPDSEFPVHTHTYNEYYIILDGTLEVILNPEQDSVPDGTRYGVPGDCSWILGPHSTYHVNAGVPHRMRTFSDGCKVLMIAIPGTDEYPKGAVDGRF